MECRVVRKIRILSFLGLIILLLRLKLSFGITRKIILCAKLDQRSIIMPILLMSLINC